MKRPLSGGGRAVLVWRLPSWLP
uniref:Uncharacterized protein n=1 Tax=Anguilla anguilla TaxID=7936 RepID=A0A0E9TE68_ANGAN